MTMHQPSPARTAATITGVLLLLLGGEDSVEAGAVGEVGPGPGVVVESLEVVLL